MKLYRVVCNTCGVVFTHTLKEHEAENSFEYHKNTNPSHLITKECSAVDFLILKKHNGE